MIYVHEMREAIEAFERAQHEAFRAETARQRAWDEYIVARDYAADTLQAQHDAERAVVREAGLLSRQTVRPNRDARRAQVLAGVDAAVANLQYDYEPEDDGLPY